MATFFDLGYRFVFLLRSTNS